MSRNSPVRREVRYLKVGSKSRNLCRIGDFQVWRNYFAGVKFLGQDFSFLNWDVRGNSFSKKCEFLVLVNLFFMIK